MKRMYMTAMALALLVASGALPAQASNGVFDFADPCVAVIDSYHDGRDAAMAELAQDATAVSTAQPTPEYRAAWLDATKTRLRSDFDANEAPGLRAMGVPDMNKAYDVWFQQKVDEAGPAAIDKLVSANLRGELNDLYQAHRAAQLGQLSQDKKEVDRACKSGFGDQALRVTLNAALAPVRIVGGNLEGAKREPTVIGKAVRVTTGISLTDIGKHGLLGGHNSEANKVKRFLGL